MAGVIGVVSNEECFEDLYFGLHYLQHRAQDFCGVGWLDGKKLESKTHRGLVEKGFSLEALRELKSNLFIGSVAGDRQPVSELSQFGGMLLSYDGNIINYEELTNSFLKEGETFSNYSNLGDVKDTAVVSKIISREVNFVKGVERLVEVVQGDFAIVGLTREGVYATRGWGRKPLILGKKDGTYAVSSESNSFENTGLEIVRDVKPGEIVLLNQEGIHSKRELDLSPIKYGTFEWIYTAYPPSVIDGKSVSEVRKAVGRALAEKYPVEADIVSPIPNSGRWHAVGYSQESGLRYEEVFVRYDYSGRSFTRGEQAARDLEARTKLIPVRGSIEGKRIIIVDDSIVRATQMLNRVKELKRLGAKEVHARIACPPLMAACEYGKTTKKDEDCIARRMPVDRIRELLGLDSLEYATADMLEKSIGLPRDKLCLACWGEH